MEDTTKLDQLPKDDPQLQEKTSELLAKRLDEEKRKAEIREEMKMAKAREETRAKKAMKEANNTTQAQLINPITQRHHVDPEVTPQVSQQPATETPTEIIDPMGNVTNKVFQEKIANINKVFAWLEQYITAQNVQNAKVDKFIQTLSKAIEEFNKK